VLDGDGAPVTDGMIEIWQADREGRYAGQDALLSNSQFLGFGRCATDQEGRFAFATVKPGRVPAPTG
jgi:protocatechuate 3,4-dioxygenase alpha subunit